MDDKDLDKTIEVSNMIIEEYNRLNKDDILVIEYNGKTNLYHILVWYISYEHGRSKMHFDNRYFNYYRLIEMLNNNAIEYINHHISYETINRYFKNSVAIYNSKQRDFEVVSKFYIADNVGEKIMTRKLFKGFKLL